MQSLLDNHANQLNPNNDAYYQSRGLDERPDNWNLGINNSESDDDSFISDDHTYFSYDNTYISDDDKYLSDDSINYVKKKISKKYKNTDIKLDYKDYPYLFYSLQMSDIDEYDTKVKIEKFLKHNNLSSVKTNSINLQDLKNGITKITHSVSNWDSGLGLKQYLQKNMINMNCPYISSRPSSLFYSDLDYKFKDLYLRNLDNYKKNYNYLIIPPELIIKNFTNIIISSNELYKHLKIFNKIKGTQEFGQFISSIYKCDSKLTDNFIELLKDCSPCLLLYISKNGTFSLINENNKKIIYEYKLPKKYSNNKIINVGLLENDNILIQLDNNLLFELNIIKSELKFFLSQESILKDEENQLNEIKNIMDSNLDIYEKLKKIKLVSLSLN